MTRIALGGIGAAEDVATQSGRPHFILEAARLRPGEQWDDLGLAVRSAAWQRRRYLWNLGSLISGRGVGGFQYTDEFLERLWAPVRERLSGATVLNWTQLYPSSVVRDTSIARAHYIDQTLTQLFDGYGIRGSIGSRVVEEALEREATGYAGARALIATSEWGRRALAEIPGVIEERTHVVLPGASLPLNPYAAWASRHEIRRSDASAPLRLAFVGNHPLRKGLDRLLRAVILARQAGARIAVSVVGAGAEHLPRELRVIEGVVWHGRIDKTAEADRFVRTVADADLGCLLSRAEAAGIGLREYQALGLGVIAPNVGGSPEQVLHGAGELIDPSATDEEIASTLLSLAEDRARVDAMRAEAWRRREEMLWPAAVARIAAILEDI